MNVINWDKIPKRVRRPESVRKSNRATTQAKYQRKQKSKEKFTQVYRNSKGVECKATILVVDKVTKEEFKFRYHSEAAEKVGVNQSTMILNLSKKARYHVNGYRICYDIPTEERRHVRECS